MKNLLLTICFVFIFGCKSGIDDSISCLDVQLPKEPYIHITASDYDSLFGSTLKFEYKVVGELKDSETFSMVIEKYAKIENYSKKQLEIIDSFEMALKREGYILFGFIREISSKGSGIRLGTQVGEHGNSSGQSTFKLLPEKLEASLWTPAHPLGISAEGKIVLATLIFGKSSINNLENTVYDTNNIYIFKLEYNGNIYIKPSR